MQAAGDLVAVATELAARVQLRQNDRQCRKTLVCDHIDRDAGTGVANGDGVVRMDGDVDEIVAAGERLVDGIVDHLVDEMVEAPGPRRPDVHPGA